MATKLKGKRFYILDCVVMFMEMVIMLTNVTLDMFPHYALAASIASL